MMENNELEEEKVIAGISDAELDKKGTSQAQEPEPEQPGKEKGSIKVDKAEAEILNFNEAERIYQFNDNRKSEGHKYFINNIGVNGEKFSKEMLEKVEVDEIDKLLPFKSFFTDDMLLKKSKELVEKYGVLLIFGPPKASLKEVAYLIGGDISDDLSHNTLLVSEPLSEQVRINFNSIFNSSDNGLSETVIIFKDPIRRKNIDFRELLNTMKSESDFGQSVLASIRKNRTFLILVINAENLKEFSGLDKAPFALEVGKPSLTSKIDFFKKKLSLLAEAKPVNKAKTSLINISETATKVVGSELVYYSDIDKLIYRIEDEIRISPEMILMDDKVSSLVRQVKDLKVWVVDEIGNNLKEWSFVLSLGLLSSVPGAGFVGVSVVEFELFRSRLEAFLADQEQLKREKKEWPGLVAETSLVERCGANKFRHEASGKTYLNFKEDNFLDDLWEVFTEELSLNLIHLIPFLKGLIQSGEQRSYAAKILGRIGEFDQDSASNWITFFSHREAAEDRAIVADLFHGVYASRNKFYIERSERLLARFSRSESYEQLWSAVIAYKQVGLYRLGFALEKLGDMLENKLVGPYGKVRKLLSEHLWSANKLLIFSTIIIDELKEYIANSSELEARINELKNYDHIFTAISYSVSGLCIQVGPLPVFEEWSKWLDREPSPMKIFFIKMLLSEDGVLDRLDGIVTFFNEEADTREEWHYMVMNISYGEKAGEILLSMFKKVVQNFAELDANEVRVMEDALVKYLANWAKASVNTPDAKSQIVTFLGELLFQLPSIHKVFELQLKKWEKENSLTLKTLSISIKNAISQHQAKADRKTLVDVSKWKI